MSRRNREDGTPPISLFAFQDLISTLSGVFIFLVLFMAVDVAMRKNVHARSGRPGDNTAVIAQKRRLVDELKRDVDALNKALNATVSQDVVVLARDVTARAKERDALQARVQSLNGSRECLEQQVQAAQQEKARKDRDIQPLREELLQLRAAHAKAIEESKIFFIPEAGSPKTPVLLECSGTSVRVGFIDRDDKPLVFETNARGISECEKFLHQFSATREYFVFMVKPSSVSYYSGLVANAIDAGFDAGYDALEEGKSVGFGKSPL